MPFGAESPPARRRTYTVLVLLLAMVAGAVNATAFFAVGLHTSHMSGNLATVGEMLGSGRWELAMAAIRLVLAFVAGAVAASFLLDASRHRQRGRHAAALLVEAVTLSAAGLWMHHHPQGRDATVMWGLTFSMGLQNALVTRVSGAVVRTTHMTGVLTDLGIELVRMVTWVRDGARGQGVRGLMKMLRALPAAVQFARTRLHVGLLLAFLAGCTAGPVLYLAHGAAALAPPCVVLLLLVVLDLSPAGEHLAHLQQSAQPAPARR
jgi:uncharacterized membrane protein YoaK (UPF0700 family)